MSYSNVQTIVKSFDEQRTSTTHRRVANIIFRRDLQKLLLFLIDLQPGEDGYKTIYAQRSLSRGARVTFKPLQKPCRELLQCRCCQLFEHTKALGRGTRACVKCGWNHMTADCSKFRSSFAMCLHCKQNHLVNYRGCAVC